MKTNIVPDLSSRPHTMKLERVMRAGADQLYRAWTERFDCWFAQPGELIMVAEIDKPYFFYNRTEWGRHAHYGRFLELEKDRLVVMTWLTGNGGTFGAETVLRVELIPQEDGTLLRMTHSGFEDEASCRGHEDNWPAGLDFLDEALSSQKV